jgi:hypothetical protein
MCRQGQDQDKLMVFYRIDPFFASFLEYPNMSVDFWFRISDVAKLQIE